MLLHAEGTWGTRNTIYTIETLTDETGEVLVDENGEVLTAYGQVGVIVLHARETSMLLHGEDVP
jgi:hypothetical protein